PLPISSPPISRGAPSADSRLFIVDSVRVWTGVRNIVRTLSVRQELVLEVCAPVAGRRVRRRGTALPAEISAFTVIMLAKQPESLSERRDAGTVQTHVQLCVSTGRPRPALRGEPVTECEVGGMTAASVEPLNFDPYDDAFHEDPYPVYQRLRTEAPLYYNPDLDFWALSRHADVFAGFRDATRLSSANGVSLDPAAWGPHAHHVMSFLAMDDPRHMRMRRLVFKGFTPKRVAEMTDRIRELTLEHLEPGFAGEKLDWIEDFAGKLPMDVISEMLGVPAADRAEIRRLADLVVHREDGVLDVPMGAIEASVALIGYYTDM